MRKILAMLLAGAILLVLSVPSAVVDWARQLRVITERPAVEQKPWHHAGWWFSVPKPSPPVIPPTKDPASVIPPPAHPAPMVPPLAEVIYVRQIAADAERPSAGALSK